MRKEMKGEEMKGEKMKGEEMQGEDRDETRGRGTREIQKKK